MNILTSLTSGFDPRPSSVVKMSLSSREKGIKKNNVKNDWFLKVSALQVELEEGLSNISSKVELDFSG